MVEGGREIEEDKNATEEEEELDHEHCILSWKIINEICHQKCTSIF